MTATFDQLRDPHLTRPDGRVVAWTEAGGTSIPVLRLPGTPGCRYSSRVDHSPWLDRGIRMITTERPGFGASTRLPGRRFAEHADDLAAILDHLGLDAVHVLGGSGGGPHVLAFAARHPDRVLAATVVSGIAPVTDAEIATMVEDNRTGYEQVRTGDLDALRADAKRQSDQLRADPLAGLEEMLAMMPEADRQVMGDPAWQQGYVRSMNEATVQGVDGWVDEVLAVLGPWDFDPSTVRATVTWWHAGNDGNCPVTAAERLVEQLPHARLVRFGDHEGHLASYHREGEILDELLSRTT